MPLRNGDPVFESGWQARVFGMAVGLCERGVYDWDAFKTLLIKHVGADVEKSPPDYYGQFLAAFEELLETRQLVTRVELQARIEAFAAGRRPEQYLGNPSARVGLGFAPVARRT